MVASIPLPPLDLLKKRFVVDATSPSGLRHNEPASARFSKGDIAGGQNHAKGYWQVRVSVDGVSRKYYVHRIIYFLTTGVDPEGMDIDHIDSRQDNLNIRIATSTQNHANRSKGEKFKGRQMSSKHKGVYWSKQSKKWQAQIKINGKAYNLGVFAGEDAAAAAYNKAAFIAWGEFARLNVIKNPCLTGVKEK
jgi:hypothetical protein